MNSTPSFPPQAATKQRILVVDDNASDTLLVKLYLEQTNDYEVREENNVRKAQAAAEEFRPHLILLDIRMPGIDGIELAGNFRGNPRLSSVPLVFLTSLISREDVASGGGTSGQFPMLAKPIVLPELLDCLRMQLRA